jgi:hypothetical protein
MDEKMNKGQVTIWVILALVIVATIILFLFFSRQIRDPTLVSISDQNPEQFISKCVKNNVNEVVDLMLPKGGFVNPEHTRLYEDTEIAYLCYHRGNYNPCINQHPLLLTEMKQEIENYISPRIENCFEDYKIESEKRGVEVSMDDMDMKVILIPRKIFVNIDRDLVLNQFGESSSFSEFDIEVINPIYDIARVAMEIVNQEAQYCNFEYVGYMILYPDFKISKFPMSDSSDIYTIVHKDSEKKMNLAVRSCAIPPGI